MFRSNIVRSAFSASRFIRNMATSALPDLTPIKLDSQNSKSLYSIVNIYQKKYLVTKGDTIILPFKLKNAEIGDSIIFNEVIELGSPQYTYHDDKGIPEQCFDIQAKVVEITREPLYEVVRRKRRCRKRRRIPVEPFQTHLVVNELKLN